MSLKVWRFGEFEFDELRHELRRNRHVLDLESKPKEVLALLLRRAGEVVTQAQIIEHVWAGRRLSEASIGVAVNKLRDAFGEENRQSIIRTIKGGGYTMAVPVAVIDRSVVEGTRPTLAPGSLVPGCNGWLLEQELASSIDEDVWIARRLESQERRVMRLAFTATGLARLSAAMGALDRLQETGPEQWRFGQILARQLDAVPYRLEVEYLGQSLPQWVASQGGLASVSERTRVHLLEQAALAVQAAHQVELIHGALRPEHLHITFDGTEPLVRISGFSDRNSSGEEAAPPAPAETSSPLPAAHSVYRAPELSEQLSPTVLCDVYSLGILLYQLVALNLSEGPLPGWEERVTDPVLRQDIADAANLNPHLRLPSAGQLAARLKELGARREQHEALRRSRERADLAERELALERARRPLRRALSLSLSLGCLICLLLLWRALHERNEARHQAAITQAMNTFLAVDVLSRDNPIAQKGSPSQTLDEAIQGAAASIDTRFPQEPLVAAGLHTTVAQALASQTEFPAAAREFQHAEESYLRGEGPDSPHALQVRYEQAIALARNVQPGSLKQAEGLLAQTDAKFGTLSRPPAEVRMWRAEAQGICAAMAGDGPRSLESMHDAVAIAESTPSVSAQTARIFRQRLIATEMKRGDPATAERDARVLIARAQATEGDTGPAVLGVRLTLTEAVFLQGRYAEAIAMANALYPLLVAKVGASNDQTLTLLGTRASAEGETEQWAASVRDDATLHSLAAEHQGAASYLSVGSLLDEALSECREGKYAEGTAHAREGMALLRQAGEALAGLQSGASQVLASCLVLPGQLRRHGISEAQATEAQKLLQTIDIAATEKMTSDPTWGGEVWLLTGDLDVMEGKDEAARTDAARAAETLARGKTGHYEHQELARLDAAVGLPQPAPEK